MWQDRISSSVADVPAVRCAIADHLAEAGAAHDEIEVVGLLVSEVVSNAILHGRGRRSVAVEVTPTQICVEVSDGARTHPVVQPLDVSRIGGNGMRIVDALASAWGVHRIPGDGKRVWFQVLRSGADARPVLA